MSFAKTLVILGPTASGKTAVSIEVAKKVGGEIIAADSRTIYKGMDLGTAKPLLEEQQGIKHWGLDLVRGGSVEDLPSAYLFLWLAQVVYSRGMLADIGGWYNG